MAERTDEDLVAAIRARDSLLCGSEIVLLEILEARVAERTPLTASLRALAEGLEEALESREAATDLMERS